MVLMLFVWETTNNQQKSEIKDLGDLLNGEWKI